MASTGKSGWGSFLQQAVAGVEARLDTILADEEGFAPSTQNPPASKQQSPSLPSAATAKPAPQPSQSTPANKQTNKLQQRLAKAVAAKSSPRTSMSLEPNDNAQPPQSTEQAPNEPPTNTNDATKPEASTGSGASSQLDGESSSIQDPSSDTHTHPDPSAQTEQDSENVARQTPCSTPGNEHATLSDDVAVTANDESFKLQEATVSWNEHQNEINDYIERIDKMAAKIKFLTENVLQDSEKSAGNISPEGIERRLAEKDRQIALLIKEGQELSMTDQKNRTAIKKFRTRVSEQDKATAVLQIELQAAKSQVASLQLATKSNNELEKDIQKTRITINRLESEVLKLKFELETKETTVKTLRAKIQSLVDAREATSNEHNTKTSEADMRLLKDLQDTVASMKIEKDLASGRANKQIADLKTQLDAALDKNRKVEAELKKEVHALEAKLEAARVYAEEVSSISTGDSNAKMLRQVETLQTQYSIANENWQGIESSLLARVANLEKERDEATRRESEMRKKVRESTVRLKNREQEIAELKSNPVTVDDQPDNLELLSKLKEENQTLQLQLKDKESAVSQLQLELEQRQKEWQASFDRTPTERWHPVDENTGIETHSTPSLRPDSPQSSLQSRQFSLDSLSTPNTKLRKVSVANSQSLDPERPSSRWGTPQWTLRAPPLSTGARSNSAALSLAESSADQPLSPSMGIGEGSDVFNSNERPTSPHHLTNDMVSVSTVAAGPSIQLVDRLSATVRRLETEKVASREEMVRIAGQRDEARAEISALMKEIQDTRTANSKVLELEAEVKEVNARYQTTLEMLGEKSELVEELRADVQDVKAMYRELVESTVGK
ncbi:hypothetical protein BROUX41_006052 [Berkeleyomyces rouxiae]